ncbi:odorant receptor 67c-like [Leptopilina boulardi]|uniref:odorant receptor 67c-like n=1 Tax=Leptopilina boulardi TaxID=63433 RepID=UPI0021F55C08|nr:odorant receptor 67c-like [Leptopilina boulardi]
MTVGEFSFKIMEYFGVWRPISWQSIWAIRLYNLYNFFMLAFLYFFTLTFFISLFENKHNKEVFMENSFYFSTLLVLCFKITYVRFKREEIIALTNMFLQGKCIPRNQDEFIIQQNILAEERSNTRSFMTFCLITCTVYTVLPLTKRRNISLPFKSWSPYKIDSTFTFWMTYFFQFVSACIFGVLFAAIEILAPIIMEQICTQLEFIICRLYQLPKLKDTFNLNHDISRKESAIVNNCVEHHIFIFSIEKEMNKLFGFMVAVQFFVSTANLCTGCFNLTTMKPTSTQFWSVIFTINSYLVQIFLYCLYGEKVIQKSVSVTDRIYSMDWNSLSKNCKQQLIIIMMRSRKPINLTGASLITMSVETLLKILKTSYSVFNLIRNTN